MSKTDPFFNPDQYATVAERIELFYARYPEGRINTDLVGRADGEITFKAHIYRSGAETLAAATGWASEREGDGEINRVACLENTETSAVGRALANLGFTASGRRPSREEMEKAARLRGGRRVNLSVPGAVMEAYPARLAIDADPLQRRANAVHDLLGLIERAEAIGFSERRGATLRGVVRRTDLTPHTLTRLERRLRAWMARHRPHSR
jgi:hypothetical protein